MSDATERLEKLETVKAHFAATMRKASQMWKEQRAIALRAEQEKFSGVARRAQAMLDDGSPLEDVIQMVIEEYAPDPDIPDPERD